MPLLPFLACLKSARGGVDTAQVSTEVVEERSSTPLTGIDVLKGWLQLARLLVLELSLTLEVHV